MTTLTEIVSDSKSANVLNSITSIFKKTEDERTGEDNRVIVDFLEKVPYLKSLSETFEEPRQFLWEFSQLFQYEVLTKGQALGHHEEMCEKFWIVLQGDVRTFVPKPPSSFLFDPNLITSKPPEMMKRTLSNIEASLEFNNNSSNSSNLIKSKSKNFEHQSTFNLLASLQKVPETNSLDLDEKKSIATKSNPTTNDVILEVDEHSQADDRNSIMSLRRIHSRSRRNRSPIISTIIMPPNTEEIDIFRGFNMQSKYFAGAGEENLKFERDKNFGSGSCFNDLKVNPCMPLPSTIVCWEESHVISIPMKTYVQEMKEKNRNISENLELLDQIFKGMQERTLIMLAFAMERRVFRRSEILYEEDNECAYLYIIEKGDIELSKNVALKVNQGNDPDSNSRPKLKNKRTPVLVLSDNQLIGEELFLNYETYCFTARVKSSDAILHMIPKDFLMNTRPYHQAFHELAVEIATSSLNSKRSRVFQTLNEAQVAFDLFDVPSTKERIERAQTKSALDYFTHISLNEQESLRDISPSSPHIRIGPEISKQLTEPNLHELQHLAMAKAKVIRHTMRYAIKDDLETDSPIRKLKREYEERCFTELLEAHTKKPNYSNVEDATTLSVWNIALKESTYLKRVKALKHSFMKKQIQRSKVSDSPTNSKFFGYENDPFGSSNLRAHTLVDNQLEDHEGEIRKMMNRLNLKEQVDNIDTLKFPPLRVETMPTEANEQRAPTSSARRLNSESIERTLRKEVDDMLTIKTARNKEIASLKVKHNKIKKGLSIVLPERLKQNSAEKLLIQSHRAMSGGIDSLKSIGTIKVKDLLGEKKPSPAPNFNLERFKGGRRTSRGRIIQEPYSKVKSSAGGESKKIYLAELGLESGTITSTRRSRVSVSTGKGLLSRDASPLPTEPAAAVIQKYEDHQSMVRFPSVRSVTRPRNASQEKNMFELLDQKVNLDERKDSYGSLRSFRLTNYSQKYL